MRSAADVLSQIKALERVGIDVAEQQRQVQRHRSRHQHEHDSRSYSRLRRVYVSHLPPAAWPVVPIHQWKTIGLHSNVLAQHLVDKTLILDFVYGKVAELCNNKRGVWVWDSLRRSGRENWGSGFEAAHGPKSKILAKIFENNKGTGN